MNHEELKIECIKMAIALGANTPDEAMESAEAIIKWLRG